MLTSRVRVAACAGLLSTGLLIASSGGAVALADPDSSVSPAHAPQGGPESNQGGSPAASVTDTLRKAVRDMAGALTAGRTPGQPPSTAQPHDGPSHARTPGQRNATLPTAAATPIPNAAAAAPGGRPGSDPAAAVPNAVGAISHTLVTSLDSLSATVTAVVSAVPIVGAPASDVISGVQDL